MIPEWEIWSETVDQGYPADTVCLRHRCGWSMHARLDARHSLGILAQHARTCTA